MNITRDKYVAIAYTLKNDEGEVIDASDEKEPLEYIHGKGLLINGLENALEGKKVGDEISVTIQPKDGYGEFDNSLVIEVERTQFPAEIEIEEGMEFEADNGQYVTVKKIDGEKITIDANHPMAGKVLHFDVKVIEVRDATEEEIRAFIPPSSGCGGSCGCGCGGSCGSGDGSGCEGGGCNGGACGCS